MAIIMYSNSIFEKCTGNKEVAKILDIGMALSQVIPSFLSGELSKYVGRRPMLIRGYILLIFLLGTLGTLYYLIKYIQYISFFFLLLLYRGVDINK